MDIAFFSLYFIKNKDRFLLIMASPTEIGATLLRGESGNRVLGCWPWGLLPKEAGGGGC